MIILEFVDLEPEIILDEDSNTDIVYLDNGNIQSGFFYRKCRYLSKNFKDNIIEDPRNYIRTNSLWFANLKDKTNIELVPFGNYDISEIHIMGNFLYYIKSTDKDNDGFLENDCDGGDIYRINIHNLKQEYCCSTSTYNFHGFEAADEDFLIFRSEDQIPDTVEEVIWDIINKRKAVLQSRLNLGPGCVDYKYITDESDSIAYVIINEIGRDYMYNSREEKLKCITWEAFKNMLTWENIKIL